MVMKWDKHEEYLKKDERFIAMREKYRTQTKEAGQRVQDLKAQLEAILKREFKEGKDLSAEKAEQRKMLVEAEKEYEVALVEQKEVEVFTRDEAQKNKITLQDLVIDWNTVYRPMVRKAEVEGIVQRMENAREEYLNAILDYQDLREKYHGVRNDLDSDLRTYYRAGNHPGVHFHPNEIISERDLPLITDEILYKLQNYGEYPVGFERKPIKKERK